MVVIKLNLRKLARAGRAFRKLDGAGLVRFAGGVGKGARSAAGKLKSPRVARHVRRVTTSVRDIARNVDPGAAAVLARRAAESAKSVVTRLDPRDVTEAVRRVADTAESGVSGKGGKRSKGGRRVERFATSALARIGPERAAQVADEAVRVLKELVVKLDPDRVAGLAGEIFAAAKSANSRKTRFRVFGLLASIVKETSRAFKSVAGNLSMRDVAVVALVVLTTAPELLVALGVSAAVIRVMVSLAGVLVELFPDRKGAGGIGAEGRPTGLPEPEGELADGSRPGFVRQNRAKVADKRWHSATCALESRVPRGAEQPGQLTGGLYSSEERRSA